MMSVSVRLIVVWLVCVIAGTLAPFDFVHSTVIPAGRVLQYGAYERQSVDFILNLLLFLPAGALAHHESRRQSLKLTSIVVLVGTTALLISTSVEFLQAFLPARDSSLIDVLANTAGAVIGIGLDIRWGKSIESRFDRLRACTSPALIAVTLASFILVAVVVSGVLQARTRLSNWNQEYPLLIGNEDTGDRPWQGRVFALTITDTATPLASVRRFSDGGSLVLRGARLAEFDFSETDPAANAPHLYWTHDSDQLSSDAVRLTGRSWLRSQGPVTALVRRVRDANAFTIRVACATDLIYQDTEGPARIVSNSASTLRRNFTLGQQGSDLVVRLRTPETGENGAGFETHIAGMFATTAVRDVLVTYNGATLMATAAGSHAVSRTDLTPGAFLADVFTMLTGSWEPIPATQLRMFDLAYVGGLFLLPGALVGTLAHRRSHQVAFGVLHVIIFAILFEVTMVFASGRPFEWGSVAAIAGAGALVMTLVVGALSQSDVQPEAVVA